MGYGKNNRTLIATFRDYSTACQAARDLNENGIPQESVHIDSNQKTAGAGSTGYQNENQSGFSEWWSSFFGNEQEQAARQEYEGALAGGRTVLRAVVLEELTDVSTDILNQNGAAEIETRSESPAGNSRGGVRIYSHDNLFPTEPRSASTMRGVSFKRGADSVQSGFGMTPGAGTLAGEATVGSAIQDYSFQDLTDQNEMTDYRRHFEKNYSGRTFESMLPAYRYGIQSATDQRYRDMSWDEVESQLRERYPEGATCPWNEALPAVRYGWERTNR